MEGCAICARRSDDDFFSVHVCTIWMTAMLTFLIKGTVVSNKLCRSCCTVYQWSWTVAGLKALCNEKQQCMGCGVVQRDGYTTRERIGRKES